VACSLLSAAFANAPAATGTTIISTLPFTTLDADYQPFGEPPDSTTYGAVIDVPTKDHVLTQFSMYVEHISGGPVVFNAYVYAWNGTQATGPALYASDSVQTVNPGGFVPETFNFNTQNLSLTPGDQYVLTISTANQSDGDADYGGVLFGNVQAPGVFTVWDNIGSDFGLLTAQTWTQPRDDSFYYDLALQATFVPEPSTVMLALLGAAGLWLARHQRHCAHRRPVSTVSI
jgi:hypothetical protein